jgi:hypothetical protein
MNLTTSKERAAEMLDEYVELEAVAKKYVRLEKQSEKHLNECDVCDGNGSWCKAQIDRQDLLHRTFLKLSKTVYPEGI